MAAEIPGPGWWPPMLAATASTVHELGRVEEWQVEPKLDGMRCIAVREGQMVELWSRNRLRWTPRFPEVVEALGSLPVDRFVLDGELVAFDRAGRASFGDIQAGAARSTLVAFDLLSLLGHDTRDRPLEDRRRLLERLVLADQGHDPASSAPGAGALCLMDLLAGDPATELARACAGGQEGIVVKQHGSLYRGGRQSAWRKLKCVRSQELVVGGWTEPSGARRGLGALLLGHYVDATLVYAGKVGSGFSEGELRDLAARMTSLASPAPPFATVPRLAGAHWVRPVLVAEVAFGEWTADGRLRHPRFLRLRSDIDPESVRRR